MTPPPSPEAVERMVALVQEMAQQTSYLRSEGLVPQTAYHKAAEIAAMLPQPVEPAVLACREVWARAEEVCGFTKYAQDIRGGKEDGARHMTGLVAAYHAGQAARSDT